MYDKIMAIAVITYSSWKLQYYWLCIDQWVIVVALLLINSSYSSCRGTEEEEGNLSRELTNY